MKNKLRKCGLALVIAVISIFTWVSPTKSVYAYYNSYSTSASWRFANDYKGIAGKELYPAGWKRHKDGTLPGAGIVTNIGIAAQQSKAPKYFTVTSGVDSGRRYKVVYTKTGRLFYLKVKQIVPWQNSLTGSDFNITLKSGSSVSLSSSVTNSVSGSVNAAYAALKANVDVGSRTSVEFTQTVTTSVEYKISKKISDFDQHPTVRLSLYLYQRFNEYTAQVYAYNPSTKAYDIKIHSINYRKVSGKYLSPSSGPTLEYCWGVAN